MFLPAFVCEQDNSKTYGRMLTKFSGNVLYLRNNLTHRMP